MPWCPAVSLNVMENEPVVGVNVGKLSVALYQVDDRVFATAILCTHGQASLADGYLEDFLIECPLHQGTFDIRTGEAVGSPCTIPVRTFPVKVEDGMILVEIADGEI